MDLHQHRMLDAGARARRRRPGRAPVLYGISTTSTVSATDTLGHEIQKQPQWRQRRRRVLQHGNSERSVSSFSPLFLLMLAVVALFNPDFAAGEDKGGLGDAATVTTTGTLAPP